MPAYFDKGILVGDTSWHGLEDRRLNEGEGENFDILSAISDLGLDFEVISLPLGYQTPDGGFLEAVGKEVIAREPALGDNEYRIFRTASGRYQPLQNYDLARVGQGLVDEGFHFRGLASLKYGQVFFVQVDLPPFYVGDNPEEEHRPFLLLSNDHAEGAAKWLHTVTRVVCWNTYNVALRDTGIQTIPHNSTTEQELEFRLELTAAVKRANDTELANLNALFSLPVSTEEIETGKEIVFPDPKPSRKMKLAAAGEFHGLKDTDFQNHVASSDVRHWQNQKERAEKFRGAFDLALEKFNDEHSYAANTGFAFLNASTDVINHSDLYTGSHEKGLISLHFGNRAVQSEKAREYALSLIPAE